MTPPGEEDLLDEEAFNADIEKCVQIRVIDEKKGITEDDGVASIDALLMATCRARVELNQQVATLTEKNDRCQAAKEATRPDDSDTDEFKALVDEENQAVEDLKAFRATWEAIAVLPVDGKKIPLGAKTNKEVARMEEYTYVPPPSEEEAA